MDRHHECEFEGDCLAIPKCQRECAKLDLPEMAFASYVYARGTCEPSQLAHLPNAATMEARYRRIFQRGSIPLDTESPRWNFDVLIPEWLRRQA